MDDIQRWRLSIGKTWLLGAMLLVVAMYRLVFENADKPVVLAELRKPEHGYHENYYAGIARYIVDVYVSKIRQRVFTDNLSKTE